MPFWNVMECNVTQNKSLGNDLLQCHTKQVVGRRLVAMSHKTSRCPTTCCNVTQNKLSGDDLLQCHQKKSHWVTTCCNFTQNKSSSKDLLCLKVLAGYYLEPTNKGIIKYKT